LGLYEIDNDSNDANDDTDDARESTTNELELRSSADEGIEQDSYGYESVPQRRWRERTEISLCFHI
jgi:hypothetical protein